MQNKKANLRIHIYTVVVLLNCLPQLTHQTYKVSEDKFKTRIYIRPTQKLKMDLSQRLDFYAMSSNFSSNNENIQLPGVAGRQNKAKKYFPQETFDPGILNSTYGHLYFLEKDNRSFKDFIIENNDEFNKTNSDFMAFMDKHPSLECSDLTTINKYIFFICFDPEKNKQEGDHEEQTWKYKLVVLDLLLNRVILDVDYEDYYFSNPHINGLEDTEKLGNVDLVVFDKVPMIANPKNFKNSTRVSIFKLILDEENERFEILEKTSRLLGKEIYSSDFDAFRLINLSFMGTDRIFVYLSQLHNATLTNNLYSCIIERNDPEKILQFQNCSKLIDENIRQFHSHLDNLVYFDHEDRLFFCKLSRKHVDIKCKSGVFKKDWGLKLFKIVDDVALVVAESDGVDIIFLNYFSEDIFTWYYTRELQNHPTFIIETSGNHNYKMVNFEAKGFQVSDLTFSTNLVVHGHELNQLTNSLVYLEGVPILEYNFTVWDGTTILNLFQGVPINVVYSRADRIFFQQLGFAGNNLDFKDNSMQKVYYFSSTSTSLLQLPMITQDEVEHIDEFPQTPQVHFYSTLTGDLIYLYPDRIMISEYDINVQNLELSESNIREILFPEEFELQIENIVETKSAANEIFILLKNPFQLVSVNRKSLGLVYYEMHEDFVEKEMVSCSMFSGFVACIHQLKNSQTFSFYIVHDKKLEALVELNNQILKRINSFFKNTADGRKVSNILIICAENDALQPNFFSIILKLEFGGIFEIHGFKFRMRFSTENEFSEKIVVRLEKFKIIEQLSKPGMLLNNPQITVMGNSTLVLETDPKFKLFWFDSLNMHEFEYLDTNEILGKFVSRKYRIIVIIYRSLTDQDLYFAVYRLGDLCVKQFVRNQRLAIESPHLKVDFIRHSPTIILIVFLDVAFKRVLFSYMYFLSGPYLMGKTHSDLVINDMRYFMDINEDKSMHYNRFVNKETPVLVVEDYDLNAVIPIKKYFEIEGNIDYLSFEKFKDSELNDYVSIIEGINYKDTKSLVPDLPEHPGDYPMKFIQNPKYFAVNIKNQFTFSVFE
jgi:hypothetical protein